MMKNVLIIHTAFIGDIILATPLIPAIKNSFPNCMIDFLTIPISANLLEKDTNIHNLIIFDKRGIHKGIKGLRKILQQIQDNSYDTCICPHRSLRSAIIAKLSNTNQCVGFNNSSWSKAFTHIVKYDQTMHETLRNLSLLKAIGIDSNETRPVIVEDENDIHIVYSLMKEKNIGKKKIIAVAPGSVWPTKRWPKEYFIDLINKLEKNEFKIVLTGGEKDITLCNEIIKECQAAISIAGDITLRQTKYFLTKCDGIISNDSAPLHLGLAADIPVFSIFGPTITEIGFAPIESNSYVIDDNKLQCRPCGIHGSYKCPTKTFDCMENIKADQVVEHILNNLN
jgi:heptosyltransferase-2